MRLKGLNAVEKIYFIGIGGVSMSALAKYLFSNGYCVSGSDMVKSEQTDRLSFCGIKVYIGVDANRKELLDADAVIYTDAIDEKHIELMTAIRTKKFIYSRGQLLSLLCADFSTVIAVGGSHGKTTCTSMCAHVLKYLSMPFTAHIGGEDSTLGNFYYSGKEYLITEVCEYKKNLLKIKSDVAILLNIDCDHMECYDGEQDLINSFYQYCSKASTAFVCADDKNCSKWESFSTFGIDNVLSDYRATSLKAENEQYSFVVEEYGKRLCKIKLNAVGKCNVYNALATFAAMRSLGFDERDIANGLERFTSVKRRFEKLGVYHGASLICDYAHHPREIASTITTARGICQGKLYVVFQPHTYSRTKLLFDDFVNVLRVIENLVVYKTYPAREGYDDAGSAKRLALEVGDCLYVDNVQVLKTWLDKTAREGDLVLFLGAGDIYYVAQYLVTGLC